MIIFVIVLNKLPINSQDYYYLITAKNYVKLNSFVKYLTIIKLMSIIKYNMTYSKF